jgi:hypothetical protein
MRVIIFYRPKSEHSSAVEAFVREFNRMHPESKIEVLDADSVDGSDKARIYDLILYPAILVLAPDGQVIQRWDGEMLPLMNEVAYYANT